MRQTKTILILTTVLISAALILTGCGGSENSTVTEADIDTLNEENQELQSTITDLEEQIANLLSTELAEPEVITENINYAIGIDCYLYIAEEGMDNSASQISFEGNTSIVAVPLIPDGKSLDYWLVNDERYDSPELAINVDKTTAIQAVLRDELIVTSINADIQLLDSGSPVGDRMQEYNFEDEQVISIQVTAVIPSGYEIDHWEIDGSPYYFSRAITYFKVFDLDRAITYEAVLKAEPVATAAPEMVNVSCINATFSGGGYSGATSGQVAKGTTITVTGINDIGSPQYWLINGSADWTKGKSFSYTVNSNRTFEYTGVN